MAAIVAAAAAVALVLGALVVVLDRIGVPPRLLLGVTAAIGVLCVALAGLSGGTMRLPAYLTSGRTLTGASAGLALAIVTPVTTVWPETLVSAAGLLLFTLAIAPSVRAAGAVSVPTFVQARYGGRSLRFLAALLVAPSALVLGAISLTQAADALAFALPLSRTTALALCAAVIVPPLAAAGAGGFVRGAMVAAIAAGFAAGVVLGLSVWAGTVRLGLDALTDVRGLAAGRAAALATTMLALPHLACVAAAASGPRQARESAVWAVIGCLVFGLGLASIPPGEPGPPMLFAAVAGAVLRVLAPLAVATALIGAAGLALGYDLPGRRDRLRVSTSRRFAQARLAMIVMGIAAPWLASALPGLLARGREFAEAALVAGVLPLVLLTLARRAAGPGAGATALIAGLGSAALAYDPRVWGPAGPLAPYAVVGLALGLAAGVAMSFIAPSARPLPSADDASL
jgi:Na+/proline symporter